MLFLFRALHCRQSKDASASGSWPGSTLLILAGSHHCCVPCAGLPHDLDDWGRPQQGCPCRVLHAGVGQVPSLCTAVLCILRAVNVHSLCSITVIPLPCLGTRSLYCRTQ